METSGRGIHAGKEIKENMRKAGGVSDGGGGGASGRGGLRGGAGVVGGGLGQSVHGVGEGIRGGVPALCYPYAYGARPRQILTVFLQSSPLGSFFFPLNLPL